MRLLPFLILVPIMFSFHYGHSQLADEDINGAKLDANNVSTWVNANGSLFWDMEDHRYWVPANSHSSTIYASSLWAAGKNMSGDQIHLSASTYSSADFSPGPLLSNGIAKEPERWNRVWKVTRKEVEAHINDYQKDGEIGDHVPASILEWPAKGNDHAVGSNDEELTIQQKLAPFIDVNNNGQYDPMEGDYPKMKGDQMLWWVHNDQLNNGWKPYGKPLRIEFRTSVYAYHAPNDSVLANTVFVSYEMKYKRKAPLFDVYLGSWTDFDIGCARNDYTGAHPSSDSYFGYNASDLDTCEDNMFMNNTAYGQNPPMQIVSILNAPGDLPYMNSYSTYDIGVAPTGDTYEGIYSIFQGNNLDGSSIRWGGLGTNDTGRKTNYMFPSEPNDQSENAWSMCNTLQDPAWHNSITHSTAGIGPIDKLEKGDVIHADLAYITHFPENQQGCRVDFPESSVAHIKDFYKNKQDVVGTKSNNQLPDQSVNIRPNPTDEYINIDLDASAKDGSLKLMDVTGKILKQKQLTNKTTKLDVSSLPNGLYFLRIEIDRGMMNKKVMIE